MNTHTPTSLIFSPTLLFSLFYFTAITQAATFDIVNKCRFTVWAAAVPGGGRRLGPNQSWKINVAAGTTQSRIWGRTKCNFDDKPPNTLAEYALNQFNNLDFFDISLVDGFNVPMSFTPTSGCRGIKCTADINGQFLKQLKAPGGCNNPCTVLRTDKYCCNSGSCGPTALSKFFKKRCSNAYSYPKDDPTSTFTCPGGTNYRVVFCPR
ncbi:thaumatin-like protein [Papaver somniferum]|uniref:thaumatin-like protein n=1 Tax=Papaver somniferum TaxID=3469 RepID=UPI000E700FA0|nr:thaumatin-like protein [Papaver somniferum]